MRIDDALRRSKKLMGTLVTLKKYDNEVSCLIECSYYGSLQYS